jgi:hypothetical protein
LAWSFEHPAGVAASADEAAALARFREVRDQIDARIQTWLRAQGISIAWV